MRPCNCGRNLAGSCACAETARGAYQHLTVLPPAEPPAVAFEGVDNGITYMADVRSGDVLFIRPVNSTGGGVWVRTQALAEIVRHFSGGGDADHG